MRDSGRESVSVSIIDNSTSCRNFLETSSKNIKIKIILFNLGFLHVTHFKTNKLNYNVINHLLKFLSFKYYIYLIGKIVFKNDSFK